MGCNSSKIIGETSFDSISSLLGSGVISCNSGNTAYQSPQTSPSKGIRRASRRACADLGEVSVHARYFKEKVISDDYDVYHDDILGSGYNGNVYKAKARVGGKIFAVKDFNFRTFNQTKLDELEAECQIFLSCDHPHVARLVNVYHDKDKLSLVMECMEGGEVADRVLEAQGLSSDIVADVAYQMLLAICYLHEHNIVHRDIKLENFLYETADGDNLKLIDFGFSTIPDVNISMSLNVGTISYVAPEVIRKNYDNKCDLWSLGVSVFVLLAGYLPFSGPTAQDIMRTIVNCNVAVQSSWEHRSKEDPEAHDFVMSLLKVNAQERLSAQQALMHSFITKRSTKFGRHSKGQRNVDSETIGNLCAFAYASKFRRAMMNVMAWSLSQEERNDMRDLFLSMDTGHCGALTIREFRNAVESKFTMPDVEVERIFQALHDAGQEEIHYSEFLAAMVCTKLPVHRDLMCATFQRFDQESKGFIEADDCKRVLGSACTVDDINEFIEVADSNGDGKINCEDFMQFAQKREESIDEALATLVETAHSAGYKKRRREKWSHDDDIDSIAAPMAVIEMKSLTIVDIDMKSSATIIAI